MPADVHLGSLVLAASVIAPARVLRRRRAPATLVERSCRTDEALQRAVGLT